MLRKPSIVLNTVNCLIVCFAGIFHEGTHSSAFEHVHEPCDSCVVERHLLSFFAVGNGVKQGGVISPILFCIYIDSLLGALQNY